MDVSKLKVTELRAELSDRGLDTKGVKAVLVERLLKAIEQETGEEQEQHTILDTSTEEVSDSDRRDSKDSEPDTDPLGGGSNQRESSPETESAAPSVAVEPPTSEKDLSEVDEVDGSPQNVEESSSSNEVAYQQEDSTEFQQDNASSDVRADLAEDSTNTNDYQQSDSNVSSDFTKDKTVVYQENNSVEFQQGDNANQQWTNQQDEKEEVPVSEPMEAESTTHNGHGTQEDEDSKPPGDDIPAPGAVDESDEKMDTTPQKEEDKPVGDEEDGRSRKRRDRKNRWGPSDVQEEEETPDKRRRRDDSNSTDDRREETPRSRRRTPEPEVKKPPPVEKPENEPEIDPEAFTLAWYDSDLNLVLDTDSFTYGSPMSDQGFVYMWAGARATYGFNKGKIYYEVEIKEYCDTSNYEADKFPHQLRVGFSPRQSLLQLGEAEHSYAWESTGQLVANNKYTLFGQPAAVEDTIGVLVDCESDAENIIVKFTLNGTLLKLVRRQVKPAVEEDSEYEDVEEIVSDNEEEEEEETAEEENEEKDEEEKEKEEDKEGEEKMEGVEEQEKKEGEDGEGDKEEEKKEEEDEEKERMGEERGGAGGGGGWR
uniref:Heterogeneous nuclear ribonucleoprotein U-like protein 1 n=1 Tax=Cacopsylla melanoneura TaxID=428564 RepID=A0A8D9B4M8_9HEMI